MRCLNPTKRRMRAFDCNCPEVVEGERGTWSGRSDTTWQFSDVGVRLDWLEHPRGTWGLMTQESVTNHAAFIWSVADLLRGDHKRHRHLVTAYTVQSPASSS